MASEEGGDAYRGLSFLHYPESTPWKGSVPYIEVRGRSLRPYAERSK
jgi:hypothetical protein